MRKKVAIYTAITKGSSILHEPSVISAYCDYICFTNNLDLHSPIWEIRPFPENGLDSIRKKKQVKVLPHLLLPGYEYTIWMEDTIEMINSIDPFIENYLFEGKHEIYAFKHAQQESLYAEAQITIKQFVDREETIALQMKHYKEQQYADQEVLNDTTILFRNNQSAKLSLVLNQWWEEITTFSFVDQLSFNFIAWKNQFAIGLLEEPEPKTSLFIRHQQQSLMPMP